MDIDSPDQTHGPYVPFTQAFWDSLAGLSRTAYQTALEAYSTVLAASPENQCIRLRESQVLPAVNYQEGRDVLYISGTGSGKTMQIIISALLNPDATILVMSPLLRLQETMTKEIERFRGLRAIAVNSEMHHDSKTWTDIEKCRYNVILTSPEQCKPVQGHPTRLFRLLQKPKFIARIRRLVVDECHLVFLWGLMLGKTLAFRPCWGRIGEWRIQYPTGTPCLALTATAPPHLESAITASLKMDDPIIHRSTINRPNMTYAVHPVHGTLKNFLNLRFLIPDLLDFIEPDSISADEVLRLFSKTIVFMDEKSLITASVFALYSYFPAWLRPHLQELGLIRVYHSDMSSGYLDDSYSSFADEHGFCMILIASSGAAQGLDFRNIRVAVQYGMCSSMEELLQRLGRAVRDALLQGLGLLLAEKWAYSKSEKPSAKELRTSDAVKQYAICPTCKRRYIKKYVGDESPEALDVVDGCTCCDGHGNFDLQSYFPGKLYYGPPSPTSSSSAAKRKRSSGPRYRPAWQRAPLGRLINVWLRSATAMLKGYPRYFVLSEGDIARLVKIHPSKLKTSVDLLAVLGRSRDIEWKDRFSGGLMAVIERFPGEAKTNKKVWEDEHKAEVKRRKEEKNAKKMEAKARKDARMAMQSITSVVTEVNGDRGSAEGIGAVNDEGVGGDEGADEADNNEVDMEGDDGEGEEGEDEDEDEDEARAQSGAKRRRVGGQ